MTTNQSLDARFAALEDKLSSRIDSNLARALNQLLLRGRELDDVLRSLNQTVLRQATQAQVVDPLVGALTGSAAPNAATMNDDLGTSIISSALNTLTRRLTGATQAPNNSAPAPSSSQQAAAMADVLRRAQRLR